MICQTYMIQFVIFFYLLIMQKYLDILNLLLTIRTPRTTLKKYSGRQTNGS